jgi:hypothetical protein
MAAETREEALMKSTPTPGLVALHAALAWAAGAANDAANGYHGAAETGLGTASRAAASAFPAGSPEAAALGLVIAAIGDANEEMLTAQIAADAAASPGAAPAAGRRAA